jgi:hypothetical protein
VIIFPCPTERTIRHRLRKPAWLQDSLQDLSHHSNTINMATPRLPFLWPVLFRPLKPSASHSRVVRRHVKPIRSFVTSARRTQESATQRYGTALEPAPHLREQQVQKEKDEQPKMGTVKESQESVEEEEEEEEIPKTATPSMPKTSSIDATDTVTPTPPPDPPRMPEQKPLDTVLHMPSPTEEDEHKPPHLKTPPYVHHFDTYSLVKQLAKGGFSSEQSVSIMKAVRGILTDNMELAREGLVSKSNVENETYLFRAACSELRTEVGHSRLGQTEKMRSERNQLQHEVDILSQRVGQETTQLKDELKGLFDDRKMSVRQEQRYMESKVGVCPCLDGGMFG